MLIDSARAGDQEAVNTLRAMAERGDAEAQYYLGSLFIDGGGVPVDDTEVFEWNMLAAEQGHLGAMINVGNLHALGQGVPEDYESAYAWFNLAAARATGDALELAVKNRDLSGDLLSSDQLANARRLTRVLDRQIPR